MPTDDEWMCRALEVARECPDHDDVPIGCVITRGDEELADEELADEELADEELAVAGNERELRQDPTAHAEILALQRAAEAVGSWRLEGCTLYVTLEPCAMCAGAMVLARVERVVFGAYDPKAGFAGSLGNLVHDERLNHRADLVGGVCAEECGDLLRDFFRDRR